jgi:type IV pilus assembly protein PilA
MVTLGQDEGVDLMLQGNRGFTLIELMIVVAILGILASLAVSAYQTYTVRAQVSEGNDFAAGVQAPIVNAYSNTGSPPASRAETGLSSNPADTRGSYVSQVDIVNGRVDITFGNRAHPDIATKTLSLTPYVTTDRTVVWRCGNAPAPGAQSMADADGTISAVYESGNVDPRYLPSACR